MVPVRVVVGAEIATTAPPPPTPPHADVDEGKVDQRRFNGGKNTALKVWVKGNNGKRYQVH